MDAREKGHVGARGHERPDHDGGDLGGWGVYHCRRRAFVFISFRFSFALSLLLLSCSVGVRWFYLEH